MKLFLVALKGLEHSVMPQCARDAKACAELFSGMEVVAISDLGEDGWLEAGPYMERAYAFRQAHIDVYGMVSRSLPNLMRWFVIDEYIRVHAITEPIVSIDWDSLVFENLETHFRKLSVTPADIGDTIDKETPIPNHRTAPYWVGNLSAICFYTALLEAHVKCKTPLFLSAKRNGDMAWWQRVREAGCYNTPIDLSMEIDGALFDHNATCELDDYESDSSGKKLFWLEGKPHFKRRSDGGLVKAVAIHCFWMWKEKTSDILQKATSNYSGE